MDNKILQEMKNISLENKENNKSDSLNKENNTPESFSFNLFDEEDKPKIDEKNNDIIQKRLDSKFAALAEKEKLLDQKLAELEKKSGTNEVKSDPINLKELAKNDPIKVLEELGISYEGLTEHIIKTNDPEAKMNESVKNLHEEIKQLKQQLEEKDKKSVDTEQEKMYNEYAEKLNEKLKSNEELKFINATGKYEDVLNAVIEYINENGSEEGIEVIEQKAAKAVEKIIRQEIEEINSKLGHTSHKVISDTTLTNKHKANAFTSHKDPKDMTENERVKFVVNNILEWEDE